VFEGYADDTDAADVNGDGVVNVLDVVMLVNMILNPPDTCDDDSACNTGAEGDCVYPDGFDTCCLLEEMDCNDLCYGSAELDPAGGCCIDFYLGCDGLCYGAEIDECGECGGLGDGGCGCESQLYSAEHCALMVEAGELEYCTGDQLYCTGDLAGSCLYCDCDGGWVDANGGCPGLEWGGCPGQQPFASTQPPSQSQYKHDPAKSPVQYN
jgi:hypothetical protein